MICYFQLASDVFSIGVLVTVCFGIANDIWRFRHCKVIRISWIIQIPQENTLQQHLKALEKLKKILKHPIKILVHCGCNDLDNFEVLEVKKYTEEPIKYQNTQIIISSLFPRTERNLWETINQINDFLKRAQQNVNVKFMNNHSIKSKMMRDNKLVNKTGLFIFFAFALFCFDVTKLTSWRRYCIVHKQIFRDRKKNKPNKMSHLLLIRYQYFY